MPDLFIDVHNYADYLYVNMYINDKCVTGITFIITMVEINQAVLNILIFVYGLLCKYIYFALVMLLDNSTIYSLL